MIYDISHLLAHEIGNTSIDVTWMNYAVNYRQYHSTARGNIFY